MRRAASFREIDALRDVAAAFQERTQHRRLAHDVGVGDDVLRRAEGIGETGEVGGAAGVFQLAALAQRIGDGHDVQRLAACRYRLHRLKNQLVRAAVKIHRFHPSGDAVPHLAIKQHARQHRLFGVL